MPKGDTNSSTKTSSRRREGSTDSNAKVKSEPMELKSSSDNTNSLSTHLNMKDINRDMNDLKDKVKFFCSLFLFLLEFSKLIFCINFAESTSCCILRQSPMVCIFKITLNLMSKVSSNENNG